MRSWSTGLGRLIGMAAVALLPDVGAAQELKWEISGGFSLFSFDPNLPAEMVVHDTHPDDRVFMGGSAGKTDLASVKATFLNLSVGLCGDMNPRQTFCWHAAYTLKLPLDTEGRERKQNENDVRPPEIGSFLFTQIAGLDPAHELGLSVSYLIKTGAYMDFLMQPGITVGYWSMQFEKGWDRFGSDQVSFATDATGISYCPQLRLAAGNEDVMAALDLGYRFMTLKYAADVLEDSDANGFEFGLSVVFSL